MLNGSMGEGGEGGRTQEGEGDLVSIMPKRVWRKVKEICLLRVNEIDEKM